MYYIRRLSSLRHPICEQLIEFDLSVSLHRARDAIICVSVPMRSPRILQLRKRESRTATCKLDIISALQFYYIKLQKWRLFQRFIGIIIDTITINNIIDKYMINHMINNSICGKDDMMTEAA